MTATFINEYISESTILSLRLIRGILDVQKSRKIRKIAKITVSITNDRGIRNVEVSLTNFCYIGLAFLICNKISKSRIYCLVLFLTYFYLYFFIIPFRFCALLGRSFKFSRCTQQSPSNLKYFPL